MSTVQVSRTTSTVEVSATRPRVEVGTPSIVAHNDLSGRDAADAHPIGGIAGLLPLPTADGSRYVVSHPGGANPPAWSNQAAWLDKANVFASGTVALPEIALGGSTRGIFSPNANSVSISVGAAERMRITDASHSFGIARDLSTVTTLAPFGGLHYHGVDGNNVRHAIWCYKNGVGGATATLTLGAMQGTATTPAATATSDLVGVFMGGHDGSNYASAEAIRLQASSAWTASNREFQASIFTCPNGATASIERVRVASNGQTYFQNGSASAPGVSFFSSTGVGFYRVGADILGIATAGVLALQVDASQRLVLKDGNAASPSMVFASSLTDGFYRAGGGTISAAIAGTERYRYTSDRQYINANAAAISTGGLTSAGPGLTYYGADGSGAGLSVTTFANAPTNYFRRADGTGAAPTAVANGVYIGGLFMQAFDGSAFFENARIAALTTEAQTGSAAGSKLSFQVVPNTSRTITEVLSLTGAIANFTVHLTLSDSSNIGFGGTTGSKIGTATSQKLGFWNATPIIQPAAAGQAAPAAQGQAALTDSTGGTASTTLAAITAGATYAQADLTAIKNALASLAARLSEVRTDVANIKTFQTAARTALVNTGLIKGSA